jgi:hypothetical protein
VYPETYYCIEFDTLIPPAHQMQYQLNLNYVAIVKQYIDKLLVAGFIQFVESN